MEDRAHTALPARLPVLDGLRGVAALIVLLLHFEALSGKTGLFERGYLAVDFFFMLSGFVLVPTFEGARAAGPARSIMARRVLRLWPLIALGAALGTISHALFWGWPLTLGLLGLALAGVPRFIPGTDTMTYPLNQPQWSLVAELAINALHLAVLRHLRTRMVLALSAACWLALVLASGHFGTLQLGSQGDDWAFGLVRAGFAYPLGIALARHRTALREAPVLRRLPWWSALGLLPLIVVLPALVGVSAAQSDPLVIALFAPVLACGIAARPRGSLPASLAWLGAISFPLYAVHFPLLELAHVLADGLPALARAPVLLAALGGSLGLAHLLARSPLVRGVRLPVRPPSVLAARH